MRVRCVIPTMPPPRGPEREHALHRVRTHLEMFCPTMTFVGSIGSATNDGCRYYLTGADVILVNFADCVVEHTQLRAACERAIEEGRVVLTYDRIWRVGECRPAEDPTARWSEQEAEEDYGIGQSYAITPAVYQALGGWDERFIEWGAEDYAIALVHQAVIGEYGRVPGRCWHLPHEPQPAAHPDSPVLIENRRLYYEEYVPRAGDGAALLALKRGHCGEGRL